MNNRTTWILAVGLIVLAGGAYWYSHTEESATQKLNQRVSTETLSTYAYECDERVEFTLTPSADMGTLVIAPVEGRPYPPTVTLAKQASERGARYEGGEITITARGESVTLNEAEQAVINCSPKVVAGEAPLDFGN